MHADLSQDLRSPTLLGTLQLSTITSSPLPLIERQRMPAPHPLRTDPPNPLLKGFTSATDDCRASVASALFFSSLAVSASVRMHAQDLLLAYAKPNSSATQKATSLPTFRDVYGSAGLMGCDFLREALRLAGCWGWSLADRVHWRNAWRSLQQAQPNRKAAD